MNFNRRFYGNFGFSKFSTFFYRGNNFKMKNWEYLEYLKQKWSSRIVESNTLRIIKQERFSIDTQNKHKTESWRVN